MSSGYVGVSKASKAILAAYEELGLKPYHVADDMGMPSIVAYNAAKGDYSNAWVERLRELGMVRPPRVRCRVYGDVRPQYKDAMKAYCIKYDLTMGELIELQWVYYNDDKIGRLADGN